MNSEYVLMEYYIRYLRDVRGLSDSSVKHYLNALNSISKYLVARKRIRTSVYELEDIEELEVIKEYLYNDVDFVNKDERGHRMYRAGLNNYYRFAIGEGFGNIQKDLELLDIEVPAKGAKEIELNQWKRSSIIKRQSIESAGYMCEINSGHSTFIAESTKHQYMEGHHVIPIHVQKSFDNSLDVYSNIVCLCPICHRLLHYGLKTEKMLLLEKIYTERSDRLARSGIILSKNEFVDIAI